jgi:hypothetical protein
MVENLRLRLNEKSGIRDLAIAMETPFEIDAYDIGIVGSIAYSPELRKFYKDTYDYAKKAHKTALEASSVPEALALRLTQHTLPESEKEARRILGDVARIVMNSEFTNEEARKQHEKIYWIDNPSPKDVLIANIGLESLSRLLKKIREFEYAENTRLYAPLWVPKCELEHGYEKGFISNTIHHFKTQWMNMKGRFEGAIRRNERR